MAYNLDPHGDLGTELRITALECLDDALERLTGLTADATTEDIETAVHETRKRCKEVRGLARLARPALGKRFARFNATVRDSSRELSALRDAHALLGTIEDLSEEVSADDAPHLDAVRARQEQAVAAVTADLSASDPRISRAVKGLRKARGMVEVWSLADDVRPVAAGLTKTYVDGREALATAHSDPTDHHVHEWRKRVKDLWYQTRLLEPATPTALEALVEQLDELSDLLGSDHDLAVLVAEVEAAEGDLDEATIAETVRLARAAQGHLRGRAFALADEVYGSKRKAFVRAATAGWGPKRVKPAESEPEPGTGIGDQVERERKWLVARMPELADDGVAMSQGYIALDGDVSLRVRDAGPKGLTMTLKGGTGNTRTEIEWQIEPERFAAAWPLTRGRAVEKVRYRIPLLASGLVAELDVFSGRHSGLVVVEVEFPDERSMADFEPPDWFGEDVTDDLRYTNASLSVSDVPEREQSEA